MENYFFIHSYVSNDRTDYNTLVPVLKKHKKAFGEVLEEVAADSRYCSGCGHKPRCLSKYNAEKNGDRNKTMKINERWERLKEESHENIQSEKGILKRQIRSIQTEGHFGDIKENGNFRRFNYRTTEKVYKEFMLYAIGRNINKYHCFLHHEIERYEGKTEQKTASRKRMLKKTGTRDFCALK